MQINIHEAKTNFSKLIAKALAGEEVVIARAGTPVAKLVPFSGEGRSRAPGSALGQVEISEDFNEPLPDDFLADFES